MPSARHEETFYRKNKKRKKQKKTPEQRNVAVSVEQSDVISQALSKATWGCGDLGGVSNIPPMRNSLHNQGETPLIGSEVQQAAHIGCVWRGGPVLSVAEATGSGCDRLRAVSARHPVPACTGVTAPRVGPSRDEQPDPWGDPGSALPTLPPHAHGASAGTALWPATDMAPLMLRPSLGGFVEGHRHVKACAMCDGLGAAIRGVHVPGKGAPVPDGSRKQPGKPGQEVSGGVRGPQGSPGAGGLGRWESQMWGAGKPLGASGNLGDQEKEVGARTAMRGW